MNTLDIIIQLQECPRAILLLEGELDGGPLHIANVTLNVYTLGYDEY